MVMKETDCVIVITEITMFLLATTSSNVVENVDLVPDRAYVL